MNDLNSTVTTQGEVIKKLILALLACLILSGCYTPLKIRAKNTANLNKLSAGMTKQEVLQIMGTDSCVAVDRTGKIVAVINNPYKTELLREKGKTFEVLYYYTDLKKLDGAITDNELTPLFFNNGKLSDYRGK